MQDKLFKKINKEIDRISNYKNYNNFYSKFNKFEDIPFTNPADVQEISKMININNSTVFFTSGTTSDPKAIYYSNNDIEYIADYIKWFCEVEKINRGETVLVLMDQSFWGVGYMTCMGHIKAGNTVIPVDNDLPIKKIKEIIDISNPTVISALPSVLFEIEDIVDKNNIKIIETTGEVLSVEDRKKLEKIFDAEVYDAYGLTEAVIGVECRKHDGFHFNDQLVYLEIVEPKTKNILKEGNWGELVITTINLKFNNTPIIRYLSGDLCKISRIKCDCGNPHPKIWIKDRIISTLSFHEGYKMEKNEIEKIVNTVIKSEYYLDSEVEKVETSKYLLKIFISNYPNSEQINKIMEEFVKYSYEMMHMIRNKKLDFKFIKK